MKQSEDDLANLSEAFCVFLFLDVIVCSNWHNVYEDH